MNSLNTTNDLGYESFLSKSGLTDERVKQIMRDLPSPVSNDVVDSGFRIAPSPIHGVGMTAVRRVTLGEVFPVCNGSERFNLARYVNHSDTPNAIMHFDDQENGWMTMTGDLDEGDEVTMDYNDNLMKSLSTFDTFLAESTPKISTPTEEELAAASLLDRIEYGITQLPPVDVPLTHLFTPGLYVRQMSVPAGTLITSVEHKTEHPFVLLQGSLDVISDTERIHYEAPCVGITLPGTKRLAYIIEDVVWITFHANPLDISDPDEICENICVPLSNPLLSKEDPRVELWRKSPSIKITSGNPEPQKIS